MAAASHEGKAIMLSCWVSLTREYKQPYHIQRVLPDISCCWLMSVSGHLLFGCSTLADDFFRLLWMLFRIRTWSYGFLMLFIVFFQTTLGNDKHLHNFFRVVFEKNKAKLGRIVFKGEIGTSCKLKGKISSLKRENFIVRIRELCQVDPKT